LQIPHFQLYHPTTDFNPKLPFLPSLPTLIASLVSKKMIILSRDCKKTLIQQGDYNGRKKA